MVSWQNAIYNIFNTVEAERWYAKALETSESPEMIYKYAQMLKANGKYGSLQHSNGKIRIHATSDDRAVAFKANPDYLPKILEKGKRNSMFRI
ncbi:MAG: hypothetical protein R2812_03010 [Gelidibacter sp.]